MQVPKPTLYTLIGVHDNASADDIRESYISRLQEIHSQDYIDLSYYSLLKLAYRILSDSESRRSYDDYLASPDPCAIKPRLRLIARAEGIKIEDDDLEIIACTPLNPLFLAAFITEMHTH